MADGRVVTVYRRQRLQFVIYSNSFDDLSSTDNTIRVYEFRLPRMKVSAVKPALNVEKMVDIQKAMPIMPNVIDRQAIL